MRKTFSKNTLRFARYGGIFITALAVLVSTLSVAPSVHADKYDEQIQALQQQISETQRSKDHLNIEADNLNDAIAALQEKITTLEGSIQINQTKNEELQVKIDKIQKELDLQRSLLGDAIVESYTKDDISTFEMLASSKNLSDYFDQQVYRASIQNQITTTLKKIASLQHDLNFQKVALNQLLTDQKTMQSSLAMQQSESARLLAMNQDQQTSYTTEIKQNNSAITQLRALQAAENAKLYTSGTAPKGQQGGGGYPAAWANAPMDSLVDSWGMYNRECVSYTAWKVASTGRRMPYWGGRGNAKQWPDNARAEGIPVDSTPRPGDVAISTRGTYGHSMYVEAVNGDGTISVSQYNASWDGNYSTAKVYTTGLQFIHF
jgi:surface antigen/FtsZ-binding cell division protein ZapB